MDEEIKDLSIESIEKKIVEHLNRTRPDAILINVLIKLLQVQRRKESEK